MVKSGFSKGNKNTLPSNNQINYEFWYDNNMERVGVTLNFEYSNDSHYELKFSDFLKLLDTLGGGSDYTNILNEFFIDKRPLYEFSGLLEYKNIQFKEIHYY